jgi:hypothetical protein
MFADWTRRRRLFLHGFLFDFFFGFCGGNQPLALFLRDEKATQDNSDHYYDRSSHAPITADREPARARCCADTLMVAVATATWAVS